MKIVLAIFQLERLGGRERDCLEIGRFLHARKHQVVILTTSRNPVHCTPLSTVTVDPIGLSNHTRIKGFAAAVSEFKTKTNPDILLSFERMGDIDFWYAADAPVASEASSIWSWPPRRRSRLALESAIFDSLCNTHVFFLTSKQRDEYASRYTIAQNTLLPVIIHRERAAKAVGALRESGRATIRNLFGIPDSSPLAISICLNAKLKGVDRTLAAMASFPALHFLIIGTQDSWIKRFARNMGISDRVHLLPYHSDVMQLVCGADFMIHPARMEAAGQVIVEAMLGGIPAIVSDSCGYADEIEKSAAGIVLSEPFDQQELERAIARVIGALPDMQQAARSSAVHLHGKVDEWLRVISETIERSKDIEFEPATEVVA